MDGGMIDSHRPPLLLLPDLLCTGDIWAHQSDGLAQTADCRLGDLAHDDSVETLAARQLATSPRPKFSVAGVGLGGIVALEMLRQAPHRIERLALIATGHLAESPDRQAQRLTEIDAAREMGVDGFARTRLVPGYNAQERPLSGANADLIVRMAAHLGHGVFRRQSLALRDRPDQSATLAAFVGPALLLCGSDDALYPVSLHTDMAQLLPQATLRVILGAGHLPLLEAPEAVTEALAAWLAQPVPPRFPDLDETEMDRADD
jgi:pimeloyl-ACP methyl ester carboxylesterase